MNTSANKSLEQDSVLRLRKVASLTDIAYAAGLFDGDGCVSVSSRTGRSKRFPERRMFIAAASVSSANREVLVWLQDRWGGYIGAGMVRPAPVNLGLAQRDFFGKTRYCWGVNYRTLVPFLRDIMPYLKIKGAVAKNALALAEYQATSPRKGGHSADVYVRLVGYQARHRKLMEANRV